MANVWPPIAMPPARVAPLLAATEKLTLPLPEPLLPPVTVIQLSVVAAVQAQPVGAATASEPVLADAPTVWLAGVSVTVQLTPIWLTRAETPLSVMSPWRDEAVGLAAT